MVSTCCSTLEIPPIASLRCTTQKYDWGKRGSDSLVARLILDEKDIEANTPYAELWMGTHPNGPSIVKVDKDTEIPLSSAAPGNHQEKT